MDSCSATTDAATRAFCAYAKKSRTYGSGERIRLDGDLYGDGGDFDTLTYSYKCRESGVYFFTFSLDSCYTDPCSAELVINDIGRIEAFFYNPDRRHYINAHTSQSVIQYCVKDQLVYLRSQYNDNCIAASEKKTNLCGFCISCKPGEE